VFIVLHRRTNRCWWPYSLLWSKTPSPHSLPDKCRGQSETSLSMTSTPSLNQSLLNELN